MALWLPDKVRKLLEKKIVFLTPDEIFVFAEMHAIAQQHRLQIVCLPCQTPFVGSNDEQAKEWVVHCSCRELRGPNPHRRA